MGIGAVRPAAAQPFLSDLSVTSEDPLFATYAAPLRRSQFAPDEGYRFTFDAPRKGVGFRTDHAGRLALAFKKDGMVRYRLAQMHAPPVVTTSYSDLVKYHYEPFEDVRVEVFFQVYSSQLAIQDVTVTNATGEALQLDVYPFLQHSGGLDTVRVSEDRTRFAFQHDEPADGWTRGHDVPYYTDLQDVYLLSEPADAFGSYAQVGESRSSESESASSPPGEDANYFVEWGTVQKPDGSLVHETPPQAQQVILHDGSFREILTEQAPKFSPAEDPNIPGNGYQGAELGNFQNPSIAEGDSFTVIFTIPAENQQGIGRGRIGKLPGSMRENIQLRNTSERPPIPQNVAVRFAQNGKSAHISWDPTSGYRYSVYSRTAATPGRYDRIASGITSGGYVDSGLDTTKRYFYTLIAHDTDDPMRISGHAREVGRKGSSRSLFGDLARDSLYNAVPKNGKAVAFQKTMHLSPGRSEHLRVVRGVAPADEDGDLLGEVRSLLGYDISQAVHADEELYRSIPELTSLTHEERLTYWNAFSLMRQVMLPPAGQLENNYYVFSREPTWGWGHGGQVFHESLSMLAYVFMDAESAQESQRVYMETQRDNGYINYRTGGYLSEQIPTNGQLTTSAPWYNWQNWEVYRKSRDETFLRDAYASGKQFYNWWLENRNQDDDALLEWGGHAVLECVRDAQVAVWDEVGWPANFEGLDLNVMLVKEARSLAKMADALGKSAAARAWTREADERTRAINDTFWDEETGFFYNVDRDDHDFTFEEPNDLKRQEIIGFLPLWAGTATQAQADRLVETLTDASKFWRPHGVPSLAADDSYYNPNGYWNGPVWVEWQYLIFRGLLNYGYREEAETLAQRVIDKVAFHLKRDHTFWEMYGPDGDWAGHHQTYIWTGLVARMMIDLENYDVGATAPTDSSPERMKLSANFPDPFAHETTITYRLAEPRDVELSVYDTLGRQVAVLVDRPQPSGTHTINWKPASGELAGGMYFLQLRAGDRQATEGVIVAR